MINPLMVLGFIGSQNLFLSLIFPLNFVQYLYVMEGLVCHELCSDGIHSWGWWKTGPAFFMSLSWLPVERDASLQVLPFKELWKSNWKWLFRYWLVNVRWSWTSFWYWRRTTTTISWRIIYFQGANETAANRGVYKGHLESIDTI